MPTEGCADEHACGTQTPTACTSDVEPLAGHSRGRGECSPMSEAGKAAAAAAVALWFSGAGIAAKDAATSTASAQTTRGAKADPASAVRVSTTTRPSSANNAAFESLATAGPMAAACAMDAANDEEEDATCGSVEAVQRPESHSPVAKELPSGGEARDGGQPPAACGRHWIAWQVPSRTVLAATAPSAQRALLKDGLLRTLEANGQRIPAKAVQSILCLGQGDILAAIQCGPSAEGAAADVLRQHIAPGGARRRNSGAAVACSAASCSAPPVSGDAEPVSAAAGSGRRRGSTAVGRL